MSNELEELTKLEGESILYDMDFSKRMAVGETISTVDSYLSIPKNRVTGSSNLTLGSPTVSGNIVQLRISDGTSNEIYSVEITITTSLANVRIGRGLLRIE